jgi:hypothetical protein
MRMENALVYKGIVLGAFPAIVGAFDRTSFAAITEAAERHGVEPTIVRWIHTMLKNQKHHSHTVWTALEVSATRGCPQGGVLSPLLWSLVVGGLLGGLMNEAIVH